jgi:hypothetical protein
MKPFREKQIEMLQEFVDNKELYDYYMESNQYYDGDTSVRDLMEDLTNWINDGIYDDDEGYWSVEILNDLRECYIEYKENKK